MNASAHCFRMLDSVYHGALRFISNCGSFTHHFILLSEVDWTSLWVHCLSYWYVLSNKAILGIIPSYLSSLLKRKHGNHNLWSRDICNLLFPKQELNWETKHLHFRHLMLGIIYNLIFNIQVVCLQVFFMSKF